MYVSVYGSNGWAASHWARQGEGTFLVPLYVSVDWLAALGSPPSVGVTCGHRHDFVGIGVPPQTGLGVRAKLLFGSAKHLLSPLGSPPSFAHAA